MGGSSHLATTAYSLRNLFRRIPQVMGVSVIRQTMARVLSVALMSLLALTSCAHEPEPERCFTSSPRDFSNPEPTERMRSLVRDLNEHEPSSAEFTPEEISQLREMILYPDRQPTSHALHFDQLQAAGECRVRRTHLNHDGGELRSENVSIPCEDYWRYIALVDNFVEAKGSLPRSWRDVTAPSLTQVVEWHDCPR